MPAVKTQKDPVIQGIQDGQARIVIEKVNPAIDGGRYPIKRVPGEPVRVTADVFADGHEVIHVCLRYRTLGSKSWSEIPMLALANDRWEGMFSIDEFLDYEYTICSWVDAFSTWREQFLKKWEAGQEVSVELESGLILIEAAIAAGKGRTEDVQVLTGVVSAARKSHDMAVAVEAVTAEDVQPAVQACAQRHHMVTLDPALRVAVERPRAAFSTWYELFPRSWGEKPGEHGTFKSCERLLPEIARMGFDVLYLPPIHPIGTTKRKGKNNATSCDPGDVGSPWAIGSPEGGHKAIHPQLGTLEDFQSFVRKARQFGIDVALDMAFQCSPDHPYVKEHPQWFKWRPDGTVQYAENPPKKYEDVLPINFETDDWKSLWTELKSVVLFWVQQGVTVFRVDNPHTKPFRFWDWLIGEVRRDYPDVIFLAEAFTRPKVMYRLAKAGFSQSYTYFTWRNSKPEFTEYLTELTRTEVKDYFRPNFWTNTPDILPEHLQYGARPAFMMRYVLAATLSSNCGVYGPVFELCESQAVEGKEEYLNSEKYEIRQWDWDQPGNLKDFIGHINRVRRENPALQSNRNLTFLEVSNDNLLCYVKNSPDGENTVLVAVCLDPYHTQAGWVKVPLKALGIHPDHSYLAHDLVSNDRYIWHGDTNYIELNPQVTPAHVLKLYTQLRREQNFDYFM